MTNVDTSPSELIHALEDKILVFSHINFDHLDIENINLHQFKDTRTVQRKLKAQDYIIDCFDKNKIVGYGVIKWNSQRIALSNAVTLLTTSEISSLAALNKLEKLKLPVSA